MINRSESHFGSVFVGKLPGQIYKSLLGFLLHSLVRRMICLSRIQLKNGMTGPNSLVDHFKGIKSRMGESLSIGSPMVLFLSNVFVT